jgi:hypothetical protein
VATETRGRGNSVWAGRTFSFGLMGKTRKLGGVGEPN